MSKQHAGVFHMRHVILMIILLVALTSTLSVLGQGSGQQPAPTPKISMLFPKAGEVFSPGQKVKIAWKVDLPPKINLSWCEQEIFLSIDGGKTFPYRITPELAPSSRDYVWTVPNLPTDKAVLDIRFGSEFSQNRFEKSKPQMQKMFRILSSPSSIEEISLTIPQIEKLSSGDQIPLNWVSNVEGLDRFEVLVSYDKGAHFHTLTQTKNNNLTWTVPSDFSGTVNFKVIAYKLDGNTVESLLEAEPLIVTRGQL